jgi:hypothetical protein
MLHCVKSIFVHRTIFPATPAAGSADHGQVSVVQAVHDLLGFARNHTWEAA